MNCRRNGGTVRFVSSVRMAAKRTSSISFPPRRKSTTRSAIRLRIDYGTAAPVSTRRSSVPRSVFIMMHPRSAISIRRSRSSGSPPSAVTRSSRPVNLEGESARIPTTSTCTSETSAFPRADGGQQITHKTTAHGRQKKLSAHGARIRSAFRGGSVDRNVVVLPDGCFRRRGRNLTELNRHLVCHITEGISKGHPHAYVQMGDGNQPVAERNRMFGYGIVGTIVVIILIVWLVRRV